MDDGPILQQFVDSAAQEPFAHLVARHVHLVYSSCLRQLKDPTLADQATQATFVLLARNAARLTRQSSLVPFLFATAHEIDLRALAAAAGIGHETGPDPTAFLAEEPKASRIFEVPIDRTRAVKRRKALKKAIGAALSAAG